MANYPASIANLRTVQDRNGVVYDADKKTVCYAKDTNDIIAELEAIEAELGTNPKGASADVKARIVAVEAAITALQGAGYITASSSNTFTNKRITPRVGTVSSSATPSPSADEHDIFTITALADAAEIQTPSGTPVNGQKLIIRIKDAGVAKGLTYSGGYRAVGVTLPSTTVASKELYLGCIYNSASTKWEIVAVSQE